MAQAFIGWFPSVIYVNLYGIIVLAAVLSDEIIPYLVGSRGFSYKQSRDRGSYILIFLSLPVALGLGLYFRYINIGVTPFWVQGLALIILIMGTLLRDWAILLLGRFFSRTVEIVQGHRLITRGPYHWLRHPSYTGMLIIQENICISF